MSHGTQGEKDDSVIDSNTCSMSNVTRESLLLQAVKMLIRALSASERGMLRPWLLVTYDVRGDANRRFEDASEA
jgi:hypothetical protein